MFLKIQQKWNSCRNTWWQLCSQFLRACISWVFCINMFIAAQTAFHPHPHPTLNLSCTHCQYMPTCSLSGNMHKHTQCGLQKVLKFKRCQTPKHHATCCTSCDCYQETFESDANKKPILPTILLVMVYQHFRLGGAQGVVDMRMPEAQTLFQSFEPMSWWLSNNNLNAYSKHKPWTSMLSLTAKGLAAQDNYLVQDKHFSSGQLFQFKTIIYWSCKPHSILDLRTAIQTLQITLLLHQSDCKFKKKRFCF